MMKGGLMGKYNVCSNCGDFIYDAESWTTEKNIYLCPLCWEALSTESWHDEVDFYGHTVNKRNFNNNKILLGKGKNEISYIVKKANC